MGIMLCSGNKLLYDMLSTFNIIIISNIKGLLKNPEKSDAEHWALLSAIKNRNAEEARKVMFDHINDSRSNLIHNLEEGAAAL
jgi:DNA-binding GntR family transcriptional regulator